MFSCIKSVLEPTHSKSEVKRTTTTKLKADHKGVSACQPDPKKVIFYDPLTIKSRKIGVRYFSYSKSCHRALTNIIIVIIVMIISIIVVVTCSLLSHMTVRG